MGSVVVEGARSNCVCAWCARVLQTGLRSRPRARSRDFDSVHRARREDARLGALANQVMFRAFGLEELVAGTEEAAARRIAELALQDHRCFFAEVLVWREDGAGLELNEAAVGSCVLRAAVEVH